MSLSQTLINRPLAYKWNEQLACRPETLAGIALLSSFHGCQWKLSYRCSAQYDCSRCWGQPDICRSLCANNPVRMPWSILSARDIDNTFGLNGWSLVSNINFAGGQYRERVLHQKKQMRRATFNVNGHLTVHKHRYLEIDLLRYNMATLCVQETHVRRSEGEFR